MATPLELIAQQLAGSPAHDWALFLLRASPVVSPLSQTAHIVSFSIVLGVSGMIALRVLGLGLRSQSPPEMARRLYPWLAGALVVLFLTGSLLFLAEPLRYLVNGAFLLKMGLLAVNVTLSVGLASSLKRERFGTVSRSLAGVSALLWIATIVAGRMIAYAPTAAE